MQTNQTTYTLEQVSRPVDIADYPLYLDDEDIVDLINDYDYTYDCYLLEANNED